MNEIDVLSKVIQVASKQLIVTDNFDYVNVEYIESIDSYVLSTPSDNSIKATNDIHMAYRMAKERGVCFHITALTSTDTYKVTLGSIIYKDHIDELYLPWWEFRAGQSTSPSEYIHVSQYLKRLSFLRFNFAQVRITDDELAELLNAYPRYTRDPDTILITMPIGVVHRLPSDDPWTYRYTRFNHRYNYPIDYKSNYTSIFKDYSQYDLFTKTYPQVTSIDLIVHSSTQWTITLNAKKSVTRVITGKISPMDMDWMPGLLRPLKRPNTKRY